MSDVALNGNHILDQTITHPPEDEDFHQSSPVVGVRIIEEVSTPINIHDGDSNDQSDGPPLKKRKVIDEGSHKSSPRAQSPPWKKITADGPTTFIDNGRRRSGRTNAIPLEQQPNSGKRQTRAAYDKMLDKRTRPSYKNTVKHAPVTPGNKKMPVNDQVQRRGPGRPPKIKVEENIKPVINDSVSQPHRRAMKRAANRHLPILRKNGYSKSLAIDQEPTEQNTRPISPPLTLQKVKFRVALPRPSILTPANIPPPKKYADLREFLDRDLLEPCAGQDTLSPDQIKKEAFARYNLHKAQGRGQFSGNGVSNMATDKQVEPRKQYAHHDHLLGHIVYFGSLVRQEQKEHRKKAELLAHEAKRYVEEKQKRGRVKTAEELANEHRERMRLLYRQVAKDLDRLWLAVQVEVNSVRQRQFDEEQQAKLKNHLNRVLERTDEMLTRREDSEMTSDIESGTVSPTDDGADESDSEVMSASSSDTESGNENDDPDEELTAEQLRAKYESLPDLNQDHEDTEDGDNNSLHALGEDDSDPDVEMDSEFDSDDSAETNEDEDDGDDQSDDEDAESWGLLSLVFSKKEISIMKPQDDLDVHNAFSEITDEPDLKSSHHLIEPPVTIQEVDNPIQIDSEHQITSSEDHLTERELSKDPLITDLSNDMDIDQKTRVSSNAIIQSLIPAVDTLEDLVSQDVSIRTSPVTSATKHSDPDSVSSPEPHSNAKTPSLAPEEKATGPRTPIPSLLRGTLRVYQHEGLDWLANLYANGRNGILADEMGLGKTIQSIALLAHLATQYEVWGPHLIVVPTSVMLNWEMEFKKFLPGFKILTYYGSLEERKQKRRGWMADDSFNVCITSYQLVLQDANSFKRRRWHYMILDEAHNIKNFRSERWQTMMTFNTRARLLLTGTPLQNNLTELWSLLFFLHYGQEGEDNDEAFAGLKEWSEWFKRPVESILEHGRQVLDQEDKEQVAKLHKVIRPFLLRRLKADVEKQMPAKYEHVEMCRLSKRQRQLYDGFMSRAQTKETLASGNYLSIINALMQLRKVCNHPDLFETRPINTSFTMSKSVAAEFEVQDLLLRRKLMSDNPLDEVDLDFLQLVPISNEKISLIENLETVRRHAYHPFKALRDSQWSRINRHSIPTGQKRTDVLTTLENVGRKARLQDIDRTLYYEAYRHHQRPIYGRGLLEKLDFRTTYSQLSNQPEQNLLPRCWESAVPIASLGLVQSFELRSKQLKPIIQQYACITPAVVATDLTTMLVTDLGMATIRKELTSRVDPFHQARMKLSIAFPDKRLLQYDCGKLQRLDKLLRKLQSGGHRALIFTQMTKVLDILEQFLNIHGHRYLRLDGASTLR